MGASKAGWIHEVRRYSSGLVTVLRSDDRYTSATEVGLGALQRTDLRRTCAHLGLSGAAERTNGEMTKDIERAGDVAWSEVGYGHEWVYVDRTHATRARHTMPNPVVHADPTPTVSVSSAGSLDQVIASVARVAASEVVSEALASFDPVSVDKIHDLVTAKVNDLVSRPIVTNVQVNSVTVASHTERVHKQYADVLRHIVAGDDLLLWGGAGAGKTTTVARIAKDLGRRFELVTFSAQTTEAKLVGFRDATGEVRETPLVSALREGALVLFDEFDACPPAIAVALNTMSANRMVSTPSGTYPIHDETVLVFSGNTPLDGATSAYNGRSAADFSTKDRLSVLEFQYDDDLEYDLVVAMLDGDHKLANQWLAIVRACRANAKALGPTTGARIAVTPRAAISGARLLKAGFGFQYVADVRIRKGMDAKTWDQVRNGVPALAN
jgi:hypothetical protein